jgi:acyl-CoA thioester hydrolase
MADGEFIWRITVYYEDTDAAGLVYHANYLKFFERARTEWLRDVGFEQRILLNEQRVAFAVRNMEIEFLKPALLDDVVEVTVNIVKQGRASLVLSQSIVCGAQTLCTANVRVACIDVDTGKPIGIPKSVMAELNNAS